MRLGAVKPNDRLASYNEAFQEMSRELHYLYNSNELYYFHAEENLNKVATDRANQLTDVDADRYITELLSSEVRRNNRDVIVLTNEDSNVPDNGQAVRLVILPPDKAINSRSAEVNDAENEARRTLLTNPNGANRVHRNTLLFLAAKRDEARTLRQAARNLLAWASLTQVRNGDDRTIPGLTGERALQANTGVRAADQAVRRALVSAYRWGLAPSQLNPQDSNRIQLNEFRTDVGDHGVAHFILNIVPRCD